MELKDYRAAIDALDRELLALFAQRLSLCSEIAVWKKARGLPALDEAREKEKRAAVKAHAPAGYEKETAAFFECVIALCRASEERLLRQDGKEG